MANTDNTTQYSASWNGNTSDAIHKSYRVLPNGVAQAAFQEGNSFVHYSTLQSGTQVKTGAGTLVSLFIGTQVASGVIALYDNVGSAANLIASVSTVSSGAPVFLPFSAAVTNGIWVVISGGTPDVTITYL